jgi:thymidylate synthase (FAD)
MVQCLNLSYSLEDDVDGVALCKKLEAAGRTCYRSEGMITDGSYKKFLKKIISSGHDSVLEHASLTIRLVIDRGLSHEYVRHRLCSYSQESSRYCSYNGDRFGNQISVIPMLDNLNAEQIQRRMDLYEHNERVYLAEISEGIKPEQARDNLPTCLKTELVMTANIREWRLVLKQRTSKAAHPQMRKIMTQLLNELKQKIPILFDDILP